MRISDGSSDVCSSDLQVLLGQELADGDADVGRAAEAAADDHLEADLARLVAADLQTDVVKAHGGTVVRRAGHRDLELARQEWELRVQARPLAADLAVDARVFDLIGRGTGKVEIGRAHVELQSLMRLSYAVFCLINKTLI